MQAVIIGGGISGLTCAYQLQKLGIRALLLEKSDRTGGVIDTVDQEGFLFELGPQSFLSGDAVLDLIKSLGLEQDLLRGDSSAARYILLRGQLHPVPMAPPGLLGTSLLGAGTKLRLLAEPLRKSRPPEGDESVAAFVRRKFGSELLDRLVGPFVSGVYAGDPEKLSLRAAFPAVHEWEAKYGSVIRGAMKSRPPKEKPRPTLCSFRGGVATLTQALRRALGDAARTGVEIESIRRGKANGSTHFELHVRTGGKPETIACEALVVSAPAEAAAAFLTGISPRFAELLNRIEYSPVAVISHGYRRSDVAHLLDGFGFLVPRKEGLQLLGTIWSSTLFPGRAPGGMVSLATFAGGALNPALLERSEEEIAAVVEKELAGVLGISQPPFTRLVRKCARAIPQYNLGHTEIRNGLTEESQRFPGLFFAANYVEGPAIPVCVEQATKAAQAAHEYLCAIGQVEGRMRASG